MMNKVSYKFSILLIFFVVFFGGCRNINDCEVINVDFDADSAYSYVEKQVSFGSRVPNTPAHDSCAVYLADKLASFGAEVILQNATVLRYDSVEMHITNIAGKFYPEKKRRIVLFAHWDTRFYADMDVDSLNRSVPIDGANDGASGVGVLLEIGRQISKKEPDVGIDIVFFDAEDQGQPFYMNVLDDKMWCLGAQYWVENYDFGENKYLYGIGLDMVGAKDAVFSREDNSRYYNNFLVKRLWRLAKETGYENYFNDALTKNILDDHVFVSRKVRSIMIIDNRSGKDIPYFDQWHTHGDTMDKIDKKTLEAVGKVVLNMVYCTE